MAIITTHLCLVSKQATPNLTPLLDRKFQPDTVVLLVSPDMHQQAGWLEDVLKPTGKKVTRWTIDNPWDIEHIQLRIMELLETELANGMALNATGGTKPMSIAAFSVFSDAGLPVFYIHPYKDQIVWLHPANKPTQAIEDRIKLKAFLQAHGYLLEQGNKLFVEAHLRELTEELIHKVKHFQSSLGAMNYLASQAEKTLKSPKIQIRYQSREFMQLVELFESHGLCYFKEDQLFFNGEQARFFVNGGWLEEHVYHVLRKLSVKDDIKEIQDLQRSVEVHHVSGGSHNELDVVFLADNRFHVIECKTKKWSDKAMADEAIYKLDTLKESLGGLNGRGMLVTYKKMRKVDLQRAKNEQIAVCQYTQLPRLDEFLRHWIRQ